MALMPAYQIPRRLQSVDLSMPTALAAQIESSRLTDTERFLYNGFALRRLEAARQELPRLSKARTKPAAE